MTTLQMRDNPKRWPLFEFAELPFYVARWWLCEFLALFPSQTARWLVGPSQKTLMLSVERDDVLLELREDDGRRVATACVPFAHFSVETISDLLGKHRLQRTHVSIGVTLPPETFFRRTFTLPVEATSALDRVCQQDLLRKTPFKLNDIYYDYIARSGAEPGTFAITQWVVRRHTVTDMLTLLGLNEADLSIIEPPRLPEQGDPSPTIALNKASGTRNSFWRSMTIALCLSAAVLGGVAVGLRCWRQQLFLDTLASEIATVQPVAYSIREQISKLEHKQSVVTGVRTQKRDTTGLLDVWNEATRLLPSHSWLTELRLSERPSTREHWLAMNGFSGAASSLIGVLDASPMFSEATLTAPIAMDNTEERERFALQVKLREGGTRRTVP